MDACQEEEVVPIDFPDRRRDLFIGVVKLCLAALPFRRLGLAEEIVADDRSISCVMARDSPPDLGCAREASRVVVKKRISVIDIPGIVAARGGVHVEQHEKTSLPAPLDDPVEKLEADSDPSAGIFLRREEPIVERHPHDVHSGRADVANIIARDEGMIPAPPESVVGLGPHELLEDLPNLPRSDGLGKAEHVALGHEPAAKIDAARMQDFSVRTDELVISRGHEAISIDGAGRTAG